MPRRRRTLSGDPAQRVHSVPGRRYGEGQRSAELQRAMPAPAVQGVDAGAPPTSADAPGAAAPVAPDPAAVQQFLRDTGPSLFAGTQRPDQPITAGLPSGPGPGPEALRNRQTTTPTGRFLRQLARDGGSQRWLELAERARL